MTNKSQSQSQSQSQSLTIGESLQKTLLSDKRLKFSIRAQSTGFLEIFIREGVIQKLKYCEFKLQSSELLDDNEDWLGIELPEKVYDRFCLLVADALESMGSSVAYGSIRIEYKFEENNDEWISDFEMSKLNEIHFDKYGQRRH